MEIERSIEESATGTSGTVLIEGCLGGIDDALITCQTCIGV